MNNFTQTCLITVLFAIFTIIHACPGAWAAQTSKLNYELHINRAQRKLYLLDNRNTIVYATKVGVGKGGLRTKKNMDDSVTPTGIFRVDLILYKDKQFNRVSADNLKSYRTTNKFYRLLQSKESLAELFANMNNLDFNGDGRADHAYGDGYIGLTAKNGITGPKMQLHGKIPYWCSIALHGTNDQKNIGLARSGGCVHLDASTVDELINGSFVDIGSTVVITDQASLLHQAK